MNRYENKTKNVYIAVFFIPVIYSSVNRVKRVFVTFMDLDKAFDREDREAMWQVMRIYDFLDVVSNHMNNKKLKKSPACFSLFYICP